ncbi:15892_t:CDS:1 [Acaulospora morrowiae]|uniref:15892_t:CDS:1 n=1 Tax=Acaulospora morrowiae TaxID=94023 RepID=A0A9N9HQM6_9GLOM|nr:15892_t:CDS:1 [Acaulospora morrowiae]
MGIPGFFRWLSLRYPHIVKEAKRSPRNKTDFLYLDINAFFHVALRKKTANKQKKLTSRGMLSKVFAEMDVALNISNPQVLVYIAMDGVAPRAKMNEQRSRRFLTRPSSDEVVYDTGSTSLTNESEKSKDGFFVPVDNVSISAGTEFMQVANDAIKYYIYQRLNGRFKNLQIIFNDSSVAGEGEHKIFRFLNAQRSHPEYNSKYRHVVCGGDADFIMYALLTHEPNLRILRPGLEGKDVILNINTLRKHIIHDMVQQTSMEIDEDNIIEDFVCIANFLGNDFLPRLTHLGEARVDMLFSAYNSYFANEKRYITKKGAGINVENLLRFIKYLSLKKPGSMRKGKRSESENINDENNISKRANDYLKTICWSFQYYYGDCPSWRYFYPHHRPPTIPEILKHVKAHGFDQRFNADTPMRPFDQLICILPPNSSYLVPLPFRSLLTDPNSPLQEYFPKVFKTLHYKAILPFVNEEHLMQAMEPGYALLDEKEATRNSIDGRTHMYAGRDSVSFQTLYSLCRGVTQNFSASSIVFGKLSYDGPMLRSVNAPVSEFKEINFNKVAIAQYQLPLESDEPESSRSYSIPVKNPNAISFAHKLRERRLSSDYGSSHSKNAATSSDQKNKSKYSNFGSFGKNSVLGFL